MFPMFSGRGLAALCCLPFIILLASCASLTGLPDQPVQSPSDDYQYRQLVLENGMQVLLVSDPDTPKAAAALDVMVGSGDNPPDRAGLAHFLEHMLFLGTQKYPDAAEYEEFITEHGGNRNAYTSLENTNYFFDINPEYLPEALDRFGQFFISPKFDAQYVEREKNAVQAEYQMGLKSDSRRGLDVLQETMNQAHPFSQFTVGSLDTLADRSDSTVRDELLRFYERHYSANVMRLAVLGSQSLDELEALVVPLFNQVPNSSFEPPAVEVPIFEKGKLPLFVQVKPLATQRRLELSFPVPEYRLDYQSKPLGYLGNLVGHEGGGSLLSQLKAEGLAESLSAGTGLAWRGGSMFSVGVALTEQGAAKPDRVLQLFFAYMDMLRGEGPQKWLFEEESRLAELNFRFREQGSPRRYVSALASDMHHYAPRDTLRGPYMMERYDADKLVDLMARITPENVLVTLSDMSVEGTRTSFRYEVPYSMQPLDVASLGVADNDAGVAALRLPGPNEFIAQDVSLVDLPDEAQAIPQLALAADRQQIWFMQDTEFRLPKGVAQIEFSAPGVWQNPLYSARASLYAALLVDQVNEFAYPARLAGMGFDFYKHDRGVGVMVSGYNDKQELLLERLLQDITEPAFDQSRFDNIRQDMIRSLKNSVAKRPSSQVMSDLKEALTYSVWGEEAMITALQETSLAQLHEWVRRFWSDASAEALLFGNYTERAVEQLSGLVSGVLPGEASADIQPRRVLQLSPGESLQYRVDVPHDDAVLAWYLQGAGNSWNDKAATALTGQITKSGFFQQLRTEQQLGYVVQSFYWARLDVPGLVLIIQSPVADAAALETAMDTFMQGVQGHLDEEQFERHKVALISDILQPDKNIRERAAYYWRAIVRDHDDFATRQHFADAVEQLSLADWLAYYQDVFIERRRSLQAITPGQWGEFPSAAGEVFGNAEALREGHDNYEVY